MNLFENILSEMYILNEDASVENINTAIANLHPAWITYDDQQGGGGKNRRIIYPVAYGLSTAGNPVVRAFQPTGSTKRGTPKWKLFRLDRVKYWRNVNSRTFDTSSLTGFNETEDEQIETLYSIAPIGHAKELSKIKDLKKNPPITAKPISKKDVKDSVPQKDNKKINIPDLGKVSDKKYTADNVIDDILNKVSKTDVKIQKNIDNTENSDYFTSKSGIKKLEAPEPKPVNQTDIPGGDKEVDKNPNVIGNSNKTADSPVSKEDLKGTEKMTASYKDMLDRMNNLYKDEE